VRDLTGLTELHLGGNALTEVGGLTRLDRLTRLVLRGNRSADPAALAALPVPELGLSGNRITDVSPLAGAESLVQLALGGNPLTDVTPLLTIDGLRGLDLIGSDTTQIAGVPEFRLRGVWVGGAY
jgi:internalin A